jgi:ATP-dependent helicase HrpB
MSALPITEIYPALRAAVSTRKMAVIQAPPGAGKTTGVPLDLLQSGLIAGRIVMLEPRRLAARAAADRMAETLGQTVGQTVGYRIRGESRTSAQTKIEVVTEGILTRMIQSDPELRGIGAVIFDEFHERSLNADLGLALCLEIRGALRDDLAIIVMSATLDAAPVAALMGDAPMITSEGRAFDVQTRWLARSPDASLRYPSMMASLILQAVQETTGGVLVFLPGEGEIRQVEKLLAGRLEGCEIRPLFGAMDFAAQRAALASSAARKVVLATSIAETSLTIPDIRVVVDGGRARRARFDPASGMSRLVTERVSKAEATQRAGRAGRVAAGICYRAWTKGEEGALPAFAPPEIAVADLSALALELASWGSDDLPFLTAPPAPALAEARALLCSLGALEGARITQHGRALAALPVHPRIGHMLLRAGPTAAPLAAILGERDPLRGAPADLNLRLAALRSPRDFEKQHPYSISHPTLQRIRDEAKRLSHAVQSIEDTTLSPAQMVALAYPDRIGLRRDGDAPRWVLSGGKGAAMPPGQPLSGARLIVATDLDGNTREALVRQAIMISEGELRALLGPEIIWRNRCEYSRREGRILTRKQECLGALLLADQAWTGAAPEDIARAALDGLRFLGLPMTAAARRLRARIELARGGGEDWPDCSDASLLASAEDWLLPHLGKCKTDADLRGLDLTEAIKSRLSWEQSAALDRIAPAYFETPLGRRIPIDYDGDIPSIDIRLQEMFGVTQHPVVGAAKTPLRVALLSPRNTSIQVTQDIPRFWASSYADVRKDMRGDFPRHPWPEDPTQAEPTLRAKPKGT